MTDGDARREFAQRFDALLKDTGLQAKQVAARVRNDQRWNRSWKLGPGLISAWRTGRNVPSMSNQGVFLLTVRMSTELARGRAAAGHSVNPLLTEVAWTRLMEQARNAVSVARHVVQGRGRSAAEQRYRGGELDRLLAYGAAGRLPQLSQISDDMLGATPTRYSMAGRAPYVRRPDDEQICALLEVAGPPYPFVIVWGDTKAGKSRTLAEALHAVFGRDGGDPVVIIPRGGAALAELSWRGLGALVGSEPALVVLDDLSPIDLDALTGGLLDEVSGWAVIAGTMTARRRWEVLRTHSQVGAVARTALEGAKQYRLPSAPPQGAQREEALLLYPEECFEGSIAETLVGARELVASYHAGRDENPAGCALVQAAIDCRRAGLPRPVTESELRRLFPLYLPRVRADMAPTGRQFRAGLAWAAEPVASQVALLQKSGSGENPAWRIFDHAVSADEGGDSGQPRPIPAETWSELIAMVPAWDAPGIGFSAYVDGHKDAAIAAMEKRTLITT
jgi:hypothetical protein